MINKSDTAKRIAAILVSERTELEETASVADLFKAGITGELFREVYEILEEAGFIVDTTYETQYEDVIKTNILECRRIIKNSIEDLPSVKAELKMLLDRGDIYIGYMYDKKMDSCLKEADSGRLLKVKEVALDEKNAISEIELSKETLVSRKDELISIDRKGYSHKSLN